MQITASVFFAFSHLETKEKMLKKEERKTFGFFSFGLSLQLHRIYHENLQQNLHLLLSLGLLEPLQHALVPEDQIISLRGENPTRLIYLDTINHKNESFKTMLLDNSIIQAKLRTYLHLAVNKEHFHGFPDFLFLFMSEYESMPSKKG